VAICSGVIVHRVTESSPIDLWMRRWPSFMPRASKVMAAFGSLVGCVSRVCVSERKGLLRQSLRSVYRKKYRVTTDSNHRKPVAQNILDRRFDGWAPNRAWTTDITYLLTDEGWLYLAAIVDLGTRRIVGWAMSERMSAKLVCDALQMAYWRRRSAPGLLMHSDRGSQYASAEYRLLLKEFQMTQSMSRKGNCWDNAPMESFFKTLKVERTYRLRYSSRDQARLDIVNWIEGFYNEKRLHSAIDYRSPADFERSLKAA
jgi:putative transposase